MSDQDVFNQDQSADPQTTPDANQDQNPSEDVFADKLSTITNEDGTPKYTDVASALDSIPHAQGHISTLEKEAEELRTALAQEKAAKELLAKQVGKPEPTPQSGLTAEDVARIAQETQVATQQANEKAANRTTVNAKFSELYGAKASDQMKAVAAEAGMTVAAVAALAEKSPQAVFKLAGITQSSAPIPPKTPGSGQGDNFTTPRQPEPPKSIMGGSDTKDLVANWHAAGEIIKQQNL